MIQFVLHAQYSTRGSKLQGFADVFAAEIRQGAPFLDGKGAPFTKNDVFLLLLVAAEQGAHADDEEGHEHRL